MKWVGILGGTCIRPPSKHAQSLILNDRILVSRNCSCFKNRYFPVYTHTHMHARKRDKNSVLKWGSSKLLALPLCVFPLMYKPKVCCTMISIHAYSRMWCCVAGKCLGMNILYCSPFSPTLLHLEVWQALLIAMDRDIDLFFFWHGHNLCRHSVNTCFIQD